MAGCVKVQTGHSAEERKESSTTRAAAIQAEFAARLREADPVGKVELLSSEVRFVAGRYQEFGRQFADEWQEAEEGRGVAVEAEEMRRMIDLWIDADKPILKAWDDNLETALEEIKRSQVFDQRLISTATQLLNVVYRLTSSVIYPGNTLSEYRARQADAAAEVDLEGDELERELYRYR